MSLANDIALSNLSMMLIPTGLTLLVLFYYKLDLKLAIYAIVRMLGQLLCIGYLLVYLFKVDNYLYVLLALTVMFLSACWISLRTVKTKRNSLLIKALFSIFLVCGSMLWFVTQIVFSVEPWYQAKVIIPLAGMIFTPTMTGISLLTDRYYSEIEHGVSEHKAKQKAFSTALIPVINSLFAVGLVSLPGMMTGQILAGTSPLVAVRYQILVMLMMFSVTGLNAALFLYLLPKKITIFSNS